MKRIYYLIGSVALLASCSSSKNYLTQSDSDKALFDVLDKLNKAPNDNNGAKALPTLYANAQKRHLASVNNYNNSKETNRWDYILGEYELLQEIHNAINTSASSKLVITANYQKAIDSVKQVAATAYYKQGTDALALGSKSDAKKAYQYFKAANRFVPSYKDIDVKMADAYKTGIINVVVAPIATNYTFTADFTQSTSEDVNKYLQESLIKELGDSSTNQYFARFYTQEEAKAKNITPDWQVTINLTDLVIQKPTFNQKTNNENRIELVGIDTLQNTVYTKVPATFTEYTQTAGATATAHIQIKEMATLKNIADKKYNEQYRWSNYYNNNTGDEFAFNTSFPSKSVKKTYVDPPQIAQLVSTLYSKVFLHIKSQIRNAIDLY